ncbi:putative ribonuclease h protein [Quercus suber]|uniref:Ribonuclease h protein n=1 Tax=Quercus suber TaxID=58331 RepID=A0AAW0LA20_QUESU
MIASSRIGTDPVEIPNNHCAKINILLWNCRGALGLDFRRRVLEMMVNHFPSIMITTETRVGGLLFDGFFTTETIGYAGGLWLLWKRDEVDVFVLSATKQEIHTTVKNGEFNNALAYDLTRHNDTSPSSFLGFWLWKLDTIPKIQHFMWLCYHNSILVQQVLANRGIPYHTTCPFCQSQEESILHLLRDCPFALEFWK